jgi:heme-degrading monooxygenase HmoA
MNATIDPDKRTATAPQGPHDGPVVLINCFEVEEGRDDAFIALWTETSGYFRAQPGYRSLRLHRALSPDAAYRFVNVATWESAEQFQAAHTSAEFRGAVGRPEWSEFPSSPALYGIVTEHTA